ncbi:hypothetical protein [Simkania sp.]|uniref:hypothetical protein n=1 Tax=Simkania sp. TaxID=34094 RepID=UPI003B5277F0
MEARKELLTEIDTTIDQLIENGETLQRISSDPKYTVEAAALEKTQESLLAHLMHLQSYLQEKGEPPPKLTPSVKKILSRPRVRHAKLKKFLTP